MNVLDFTKKFPNEAACKEHFKEMRIKQGIVCKDCGSKEHYWLAPKSQFECKECHFRTTLKSGTIMQSSHISYRVWFLTILFMTTTKKGISACEMQRQLGHNRYQTVWKLMHKIRGLMGQRDDLYNLCGTLEFDEGHFETEIPNKKRKKLKRGKGSERQKNVAVVAESTPLEDLEKGTKSNQCRYFKMRALETQDSSSVNSLFEELIEKDSVVFSDMATHYNGIENYVDVHIIEKSSKKTTTETLKWVHIAISNAKRNFLGVYHKINGKYLQSYLNEFVYKLNRRFCKDLFQRVLIAAIFPYWYKSA